MAEPGPFDLSERAVFRHWCRIPIRYNDLDTLAHVNNAAISIFLEQARCDLLYPLIGADRKGAIDLVVRRIAIDYLRELTYPGVAHVGTVVTLIGGTSFRLANGVFVGEAGPCVATSEAVMVWFNLGTRRPMQPPDDLRAALAAYLVA
jgi:acyl-CoA thioester hydrolase